MKISNEAKIGFFAAIVIALAIWGFKFLKGESILDNSIIVYADFDDAQLMPKSSPVFYKGVELGLIKDIIFPPEKPNKVTLAINFKENPGIPKNAKAVIFTTGALSGKAVKIVFDSRCSGGDCAQNGDFIQGLVERPLEAYLGKPEEMTAYFDKAKEGAVSIYDTLAVKLRDPNSEVAQSMREVRQTLANLNKATADLSKIMAASAGSLKGTLDNVNAITGNLKNNNDKISSLLNNVNDITSKANGIDFSKINTATEGANQSIDELKKTLSETQKSLSELTQTFKKVNAGNGTIGQFATNDSVYHSLNWTLLQTQALMQDVRLNPKRYINLNPFRKYKPYKVPNQDPLLDTLQKRFNATQRKN